MPSVFETEACARLTIDSEQETFFQVLLHDDRNSYYVVSTDASGNWSETGVKRDSLSSLNLDTHANYYITHNGFTGKRRQTERTRQLNALFFDIDAHDVTSEECRSEVENAYSRIKLAVNAGILPNPSLIVDSGRGLHLYYVLERSVPYRFRGKGEVNEKGINFFKKVQEGLACVLEEVLVGLPHMEVDRAVFDYTRVARIPGTYNVKANRPARLLAANEAYHHLTDLAAYRPVANAADLPKRHTSPIQNFSPLMRARLNKVVELQAYRHYDCEGVRERMCFVYYNTAVQVYSREEAKKKTFAFNASFKKPLPKKEIQGIFKAVDTVINIKGEKGYYVLSASKVADFLGMTQQEMEDLQFFASKRMAERIAAKKKTQEKRLSRNQRIVSLYQQGTMTQQEVANSVGCSLRTVKNVLKEAGLTCPRAKQAPVVPPKPKRSTMPSFLSLLASQTERAASFTRKSAKNWRPCLGVLGKKTHSNIPLPYPVGYQTDGGP